MPADKLPIKIVNPDSDRIFLANASGLVIGLHETAQAQPVVRTVRPTEPDETALANVTDEANPEEPKATGMASIPTGSIGGAPSVGRATAAPKKTSTAGTTSKRTSRKGRGSGRRPAVRPPGRGPAAEAAPVRRPSGPPPGARSGGGGRSGSMPGMPPR